MNPQPQDPERVRDEDLLCRTSLEVIGVLREASNVTVLVDLVEPDGAPTGRKAVYKPIRGERPLVDFPTGTLAAREVSAYLVSELGGWRLVPPTVLRDGPLGPGSVQLWMEVEDSPLPGAGLIDVLRPEEVASGWKRVVDAQDETGAALVVVHADDARLRSMAVLDAVLDNADRKAAHLGITGERLWGFDHGLCLHTEPKLRTVLWGWAGEPLRQEDLDSVRAVRDAVTDGSSGLEALLAPGEIAALSTRLEALRASQQMPLLPPDRYPLPWPLW
ncbi:MAG: SCO1664 family protein [Ornithinimicrobium sp.]|uniref:SCO1664 family protein n=1 Tax=Ornithinimicrobium sp. TaxID=1977084 RepID=UPI0026E05578|nr:SCO1664 family protein [Ornithinimicrobium sp.]MDO5738593.1 SCO1664 family protein [Ornithinimicrobium sp.]